MSFKHYHRQDYHAARSARLKRAELAYRLKHGLNPSMPWAGWGDRPRSGAIWTAVEIDALLLEVRQLKRETWTAEMKLGDEALCRLAWVHGRSADGCRMKLYQILGWKEFVELFAENLA